MSRLYRGRYWMALYDSDDEIVLEADNARDLSAQTGRSLAASESVMAKMFGDRRIRCVANGRRCRAYFYDESGAPAAPRRPADVGPSGRAEKIQER